VPDPEVPLEKPRRAGRKQWSVGHAAGGTAPHDSQSAAAASSAEIWHSCEVNSEAAAAAAAVSGAGMHDKSRPTVAATEAGRRKSRFNQQASPDSASANARRSVMSFPLANVELER
jgi:hypothetical protein